MSKITWTSRTGTTATLSGAERRHATDVASRISIGVLSGRMLPRERAVHDHAYTVMLGASAIAFESPTEAMARVMDFPRSTVTLNGKEHACADVSLNTAMVTGSPAVALLARLHTFRAAHLWVAGKDRAWLASVIHQGRTAGILRSHAGWGEVADLLDSADDSPVVTEFSGGSAFRQMPARFLDEMAVRDPEGQTDAYETAKKTWDSLDATAQWDVCFPEVRDGGWWLRLTPNNINSPVIGDGVTYWDMLASEEFRAALGEAEAAGVGRGLL